MVQRNRRDQIPDTWPQRLFRVRNAVLPDLLTPQAVLCKLMCEESHMATNLAIDPDLLEKALRVSGEKTKKAAVTKALTEFIARREQRRILELFEKLAEFCETHGLEKDARFFERSLAAIR